jgi:hypothetical protein
MFDDNTFGCEHDERASANKPFVHVVMHTSHSPKLVVSLWASSIVFFSGNTCNTETSTAKFALDTFLFLER